MSLRDRLHKAPTNEILKLQSLFKVFGVIENPFPGAGQPTGHPHLAGDFDNYIDQKIYSFINEGHNTEVIVIEGTQGVGKTNLLNYYQQELKDLFSGEDRYYIIRYYTDPEPTFDAVVRKIFQELGTSHLGGIGESLAKNDKNGRVQNILNDTRSHQVRLVLRGLKNAAHNGSDRLYEVSISALEWLLGLRILNKHREHLGVNFRLDTIEAKNEALRDIIYVSCELKLINGIFLLLDELEKQDYSLSKTPVLRYLLAIRALIDALPRNLFLMLALTPEARRRYNAMLPAFAGRLQNVVSLKPLLNESEAEKLASFYGTKAKEKAAQDSRIKDVEINVNSIFSKMEISNIFEEMKQESAHRGTEGVTQRDFLNKLHNLTEEKFQVAEKSNN